MVVLSPVRLMTIDTLKKTSPKPKKHRFFIFFLTLAFVRVFVGLVD